MPITGYPHLKDDIFFAKIRTPTGTRVKIRNTTTESDFKLNSATVHLLDSCTGTKLVEEIIQHLSEMSGEPIDTLTQSVHNILTVLQEKGVITVGSHPLQKRVRAKEVTLTYPIDTAQIEITNKCNLSCLHCVNDSGTVLPDELATEEIITLIDTLSSLGVSNLTLSGGEPLLHPDLYEIVEHARKTPMTVTIFTNGTLVTEEAIHKFKQARVNRFLLSIDSVDENIHDTFRGKKGALEQTLHAVELLREAGFPLIPSIAVSQFNKECVVNILQYFREHNLTEYQIAAVIFSGRGIGQVAVSPEEYYNVMVDQFAYLEREFPEALQKISKKTQKTCGIGMDRVGFKADGTILACPGCIKEMGIGNCRDSDLAQVWDQSPSLELLREMKVENESMCSQCSYLSFCEGCIAAAFMLKGKSQCYDPYSCALHRAYDEVIGFDSI